jgi:hypothetical protein
MTDFAAMANAYLEALGYLEDLKAGKIDDVQVATLRDRANIVAKEVSARFDAMSRNGEIKDFNLGYKLQRLKLASEGKPATSYGAYVAAKKLNMVRALAFEVKRRRDLVINFEVS